MKKIIDIDEDTISVMQVLDGGTILTISPKELPDYKQPKDEVPSLYPAEDTHYWYISGAGDIYERVFEAILCDCKAHFDIGNAFLTKEEAEFELERRKVITKLKLFAEKNAKWDGYTLHYYLSCAFDKNGKIILAVRFSQSLGTIYFESEEQAQKAIDFAGEENVKKYYLGVTE